MAITKQERLIVSEILYRQPGEPWSDAIPFDYLDEDELEMMLFEHPDLLPGIDSDAIVCRQFETGSGPIDLLIINTQNGQITLVECKLAKNSEIRRRIVGQIIDYAAAMRNQSFEEFKLNWNKGSKSPIDETQDLPIDSLSENLKNARFTLVLAVDEINEPLKRMTLYLNEKTDSTTRVALVELVRFKIGDIEVLTPSTFGFEPTKLNLNDYTARKSWSEDEYKEWLMANEPEGTKSFETFMEEISHLGFDWFGTKAATPSGALRCLSGDQERFPLFFRSEGRGSIEIPFGNMQRFDFVEDWLHLFEQLPNFDGTRVREKGFSTYPKIPLKLLSEPQIRATLIEACLLVQREAK